MLDAEQDQLLRRFPDQLVHIRVPHHEVDSAMETMCRSMASLIDQHEESMSPGDADVARRLQGTIAQALTRFSAKDIPSSAFDSVHRLMVTQGPREPREFAKGFRALLSGMSKTSREPIDAQGNSVVHMPSRTLLDQGFMPDAFFTPEHVSAMVSDLQTQVRLEAERDQPNEAWPGSDVSSGAPKRFGAPFGSAGYDAGLSSTSNNVPL